MSCAVFCYSACPMAVSIFKNFQMRHFFSQPNCDILDIIYLFRNLKEFEQYFFVVEKTG